jgi:flagellar hook-length control protein FliK
LLEIRRSALPNVASDLKSQVSAYTASRASSQAAKQAYASEKAAATPFDSILDDTAARAAAPEPRPQRTAKSDNNDKPQAADAATKTDSADPAKAAGTDSKTTDTKTADQTTADDAKAAADDAQKATDAKPADAVATVLPVAVVIDPAVVAAATAQGDAKGEVKADIAAIGATAAAAAGAATAQPAAAAANGKAEPADAELANSELAKASPDALAALAAKADKAAAKSDAKSDAKTDKTAAATDKTAAAGKGTDNASAQLHAEAADQAAAGDPHKDSSAHARTEETANTHRGAATDTAAAAGNDAGNTVAAKVADLTQPTNLTTTQAVTQAVQAQAVAAPAAATHAAAADAAVPISGVAFEITSKALAGKGQFDIRLDPADLGKIHVRLEVDRDGNVVTHMVADRTDTLDMLRKDTAGLERALQDAGLKTSDNSLQFSLRDQSANQQQSNGRSANTAHIVVADEKLTAGDPAQRNYARYNATTGGVDIRV